MTRARLSRIFWIREIVNSSFSENSGPMLGSLLLAGATAFAGLALAEQYTCPPLGWVTVAPGAVGFALLLAAIWSTGGWPYPRRRTD